MLKTSNTKSAEPKKGKVGVGSGRKAKHNRSEINGGKVDGSEVENDEIKKKVPKTSKSKNLSKSKKTLRSSDFFTLRAKLAFIKLRQVFFLVPILFTLIWNVISGLR